MKVDASTDVEEQSDGHGATGRRLLAGGVALIVGAVATVLAFVILPSDDTVLTPPDNGQVVVIAPDEQGTLQLMTTDGAGETMQLTHADGDVLQAEWAADGSAIAYAAVGGTELADVHVMEPDGSNDRLACSACAQVLSVQGEGQAARHVADRGATAIHVAPNGEYVLVAITYGDIVIHDSRRPGDPVVVDRPDPGVQDWGFTWSPDGEHLAFESDFPGAAEVRGRPDLEGIYVVDADGSNLRQLTHPPGPPYTHKPDSGPAWSPDGSQIAFARYLAEFQEGRRLESPGHSEIWVVDLDGEAERQLTTTDGDYGATSPDWSPDGTEVAFLYDADESTEDTGIGETDVRVINVAGTGQRLLFSCLEDDSIDRCPVALDWAPDGRSLTFHGAYGTGPFVLATDRSEPRLVADVRDACCVRWQPRPRPAGSTS
jgi:TolB protein